eukprot:260180_1
MLTWLITWFLLTIEFNTCYVFINTRLNWDNAQLFCNQNCDSDLASIHSLEQWQSALSVSNEYWNANIGNNVYIGLRYNNDSSIMNFRWSDNTTFNYGTNTSPQGQEPWGGGRPQNPLSGDCISLVGWTIPKGKWGDMICTANRYFMCNDCKYNNYNQLPTYYLSPIRFDIHYAQTYCNDHCNSQIASIHNEKDMQLAVNMAYNQPKFELFMHTDYRNEHNVQIGLYRNDSAQIDPLAWLDGSVWNYGNKTSPLGQYPWASEEPDMNGIEMCTQLRWEELYYIWGDSKQCYHTQRFLCNSCDGELNKYMVVTKLDYNETAMGYALAESYCNNYLNESLASIHSKYDFKLAQKLCDLSVGQTGFSTDCWIGLDEIDTQGVFKYKDGTEFDFGSDFDPSIWKNVTNNGSGDDCVEIETAGVPKFEIDNCNSGNKKYFLCNLPSLLSDLYTSYWERIIDDIGSQTVIISNKQWINHNSKLMMDYMFKFVSFSVSNDPSAGIMFFNFNSVCTYYYISINPSTNIVILSKIVDTKSVVIDSKSINLSLELNTYYLLGITILNGINFIISFNDVQYINISDTASNGFLISSITSGYVAMQNINSQIETKYLFISGGVFDMPNNYIINDFVSCSAAPTNDPTNYPTIPTINPTTNNPTNYPTNDPTVEPTSQPTNIPTFTFNPSVLPSTFPSGIPSISPTKITRSPSRPGEGSVTEYITTNDSPKDKEKLTNIFEEDLFKLLVIIIGILFCVMIVCCIIVCCRMRKTKSAHVHNQKHMQMTDIGSGTDIESNGTNVTQNHIVTVSEKNGEQDTNELKTFLNEIDLLKYYELFAKEGFASNMDI